VGGCKSNSVFSQFIMLFKPSLYFIQRNDQADVKQDMLKFDKRKDDNYSRPQVVAIRRATTVPVT
jgi:hypothetical protein